MFRLQYFHTRAEGQHVLLEVVVGGEVVFEDGVFIGGLQLFLRGVQWQGAEVVGLHCGDL